MGKRSVISERRKFSEELKREVVDLTRKPSVQVNQTARDIGAGAGFCAVAA
jgi:transposase-like protein